MLSTVTDRLGQVTTFDYQVIANPDGSFTALVSSITDANHNTFTNHYDAQARVDYQVDQLANRTDYDWSTSAVGKVTYPVTSFGSSFRTIETDTYNAQGYLSQHQAQPSSSETLATTYTYDSNG